MNANEARRQSVDLARDRLYVQISRAAERGQLCILAPNLNEPLRERLRVDGYTIFENQQGNEIISWDPSNNYQGPG